jgi:hypothetical protein
MRANIPKLNSVFMPAYELQSYIFDIWLISIIPLTIAKVSLCSLAGCKSQVYQSICNCYEDRRNLAAFWNAMSSLY